MNLRPSGYEPDELPDCSTPRYSILKWNFMIAHVTVEVKTKLRTVTKCAVPNIICCISIIYAQLLTAASRGQQNHE